MTKVARLTGRQLIAALRKAGFEVLRIKGSHHFLGNPDGRHTVVPIWWAFCRRQAGVMRHRLVALWSILPADEWWKGCFIPVPQSKWQEPLLHVAFVDKKLNPCYLCAAG